MENDKAWARYAKLQVMIGKMCLDGSRQLEDFIEVQQHFVSNPRWGTSSESLVLLEKRLKAGGRIDLDLDLSLDDEKVKGWAKPGTYPREYRSKAVFLWGSTRSPMGNDQVAYIVWNNDRVNADWVLIRARIFREYPHP